MSRFISGDNANCVYLKKDDNGTILLCDELGTTFYGQASIEVTNAVDECTTATVKFYVAGWVEDDS